MANHIDLARLYSQAHNIMRNVDGLQPQEAFDELLKYLLFKQMNEEIGPKLPERRESDGEGGFGRVTGKTAKAIRDSLRKYVALLRTSGATYWHDASLRLSDPALVEIHELFEGVQFATLDFDARSAALKQFLSPDIRKGLGVYLTPDAVVAMMVRVLSPAAKGVVYDPACGSGTFLIEVLKFWRTLDRSPKRPKVYGSEKSPRMLQIAELNLAHQAGSKFHGFLQDALAPVSDFGLAAIAPDTVDAILTNPPFGVVIDRKHVDLDLYASASDIDGRTKDRIPSEILFVEQCLKLLKPGGELAIVLPRSVITNAGLGAARLAMGKLGYVYAFVNLPPETFATTGTQTTTCVVFARKYLATDAITDEVSIAHASVVNVGYDSTGRVREGTQLEEVAREIRCRVEGNSAKSSLATFLEPVPKSQSFDTLSALVRSSSSIGGERRLGDIVDAIGTGRTPARSAYTDDGIFILKVGNLSGHGIDWQARDRNFVPAQLLDRGRMRSHLLEPGDIVLTSSAHTPKYIAKKVDIVQQIPVSGGKALFVGEVMRIRLRPGSLDPFRLLAYLRYEKVVETLQGMVRGQTAHLMAGDVSDLRLPDWLFSTEPALDELRALLETQCDLSNQMNGLQRRQKALLEELPWDRV